LQELLINKKLHTTTAAMKSNKPTGTD
jgi:hypothetical protein